MQADFALAEAVFADASRKLAPLENSAVQEHLGPHRRYFSTTLHQCDCGTSLGCTRFEQAATATYQKRVARELSKRRRSGWSEAKIDRWLKDKHGSQAAQKASDRRGSQEELERWVELIRSVLQNSASEIGLLLHEYRGGLFEPFELDEPVRFSVSDVDLQFLRDLQPDRFYFIVGE